MALSVDEVKKVLAQALGDSAVVEELSLGYKYKMWYGMKRPDIVRATLPNGVYIMVYSGEHLQIVGDVARYYKMLTDSLTEWKRFLVEELSKLA